MKRPERIPLRARILGIVLALLAGPAIASGPYLVEDAILIPPDTVRIGGWHQRQNNDARSSHLAGAFRVQADIQFGAEFASRRNPAGQTSDTIEFRSKALSHRLDRNGFGLGVAGGVLYSDDDGRIERLYALVPFTIEPAPGRMRVHLNAGAERDRRFSDDREALFWGVATDLRMSRALALRLEMFDDDRDGDPDVQAGFNLRLGDTRFGLTGAVRRNLESGSDNIWLIGIGYGNALF